MTEKTTHSLNQSTMQQEKFKISRSIIQKSFSWRKLSLNLICTNTSPAPVSNLYSFDSQFFFYTTKQKLSQILGSFHWFRISKKSKLTEVLIEVNRFRIIDTFDEKQYVFFYAASLLAGLQKRVASKRLQ